MNHVLVDRWECQPVGVQAWAAEAVKDILGRAEWETGVVGVVFSLAEGRDRSA